jgi:hypothetical protein
MTDNEINRLVAKEVLKKEFKEPYTITLDPPEVWYRDVPPPDYCNLAAAWGALWDFLAAAGWHVTVDTFAERATATLRHVPTDRSATVNDDKKGRALALAALRAHGVTP